MAKNRVEVEMTVAQAQAVNQWIAAQRGPAQFFDAMERGGKQGKKSADQVGGALQGWGPAMLGAAAGMLTFNSALSAGQKLAAALRQDLERVRDLQREAAQKALTFEDAFQGLVRVVPKSAGKSVRDLERQVLEGSRTTGVAPEVLAQVATKTVSAGLGTSIDERIEAAVAAAEFAPELREDPQGLGAIATAAQGFLKNFRHEFSGDMSTAIREAVAMVAAASSASRVEDIGQFAKYGAGAINQSAAFGVSLEDAIALQASIGTRSDDPDGTLTRTAMINILEQSMEVIKRIGITRGEEVAGEDGQPLRGLDMIEFIRSAPEARGELAKLLGAHAPADDVREFLESGQLKPSLRRGLRTRAPQLVPLVELLSPETGGEQDAKTLLEGAQADVLSPSEALTTERAKQAESRTRATSLPQQAELAKNRARTDFLLSEDLVTQGSIQDLLDQLFKDSGESSLIAPIREMLTTAASRGTSPDEMMELAQGALQARKRDIEQGRTGTMGEIADFLTRNAGFAGPLGAPVALTNAAAARGVSDLLGEGADAEKQTELLESAIREIQRMREAMGGTRGADLGDTLAVLGDVVGDVTSQGIEGQRPSPQVAGAVQDAGADAIEAASREATPLAAVGAAEDVIERRRDTAATGAVNASQSPEAQRLAAEQVGALNDMLTELRIIRERLASPAVRVPREAAAP